MPSELCTLLVAKAFSGGSPAHNRAGSVSIPPAPAIDEIKPSKKSCSNQQYLSASNDLHKSKYALTLLELIWVLTLKLAVVVNNIGNICLMVTGRFKRITQHNTFIGEIQCPQLDFTVIFLRDTQEAGFPFC